MSPSVVSAVAACSQACTEELSTRAYEALLWAVGNSHAGTYNSSALVLVEALGPILTSSGSWSQRAALEAMIDLYGSFESEAGEQMAIELHQRIAALEPLVIAISNSYSVASSSARDLLELFHEPEA